MREAILQDVEAVEGRRNRKSLFGIQNGEEEEEEEESW